VVASLLPPPPWAFAARLLVAETHEEDPTTWLEHRRQPLDVAFAVLIGKDVEQTGVDYVVEPLRPAFQVEGILDQEGHRQVPAFGFLLGSVDRLFHEIDARYLAAPAGEEDGVIAGATAGIQHQTADLVGDGQKRRLWSADVPRGPAFVHRLEGCLRNAVHRLFLLLVSLPNEATAVGRFIMMAAHIAEACNET